MGSTELYSGETFNSILKAKISKHRWLGSHLATYFWLESQDWMKDFIESQVYQEDGQRTLINLDDFSDRAFLTVKENILSYLGSNVI